MRHEAIPPTAVTAEQCEQAAVVQADVLQVMKRLVGDGFDYRIVMAGTSCAIADLVSQVIGPAEVPRHFARLATLTAPLGSSPQP